MGKLILLEISIGLGLYKGSFQRFSSYGTRSYRQFRSRYKTLLCLKIIKYCGCVSIYILYIYIFNFIHHKFSVYFLSIVLFNTYCLFSGAILDNSDPQIVFLPLMTHDGKLLPVHFLTQSQVSKNFYFINVW